MDTAMKQDREMAEDIRFGSCVTRIEDRRSKRRRATVREMKEGPFEVGNQVLISSHRKLLLFKSNGGERCGKIGTRYSSEEAKAASAD
jgi:hypothetical protein